VDRFAFARLAASFLGETVMGASCWQEVMRDENTTAEASRMPKTNGENTIQKMDSSPATSVVAFAFEMN
jgi:hypothetical protein